MCFYNLFIFDILVKSTVNMLMECDLLICSLCYACFTYDVGTR